MDPSEDNTKQKMETSMEASITMSSGRNEIPHIDVEQLADHTVASRPLARLSSITPTGKPTTNTSSAPLSFPRKLWSIVESNDVQSITWHDNGICIMLDKDLFQNEILDQNASFKILGSDPFKNLFRQLNLYGFEKIHLEFERSPSLADFLAEEKAAAAFNKLHFYQHANFRRGSPHLLAQIKRSARIQGALPQVTSSGVKITKEDRKKNHKWDLDDQNGGNYKMSTSKHAEKCTAVELAKCSISSEPSISETNKLSPACSSNLQCVPESNASEYMMGDVCQYLDHVQHILEKWEELCNTLLLISNAATVSGTCPSLFNHPVFHQCPNCNCFTKK